MGWSIWVGFGLDGYTLLSQKSGKDNSPPTVPYQSVYGRVTPAFDHSLFNSFIKAATSSRREGRFASRIPQTTSSATEE